MTIKYFNPENLVSQFLNDDGTGVGNYNLTGNYTTPTFFKYTPPVGKVAHIDGITIFAEAVGNFAFDEYVPGTSLANGFTFQQVNNVTPKFIIPPQETFTTLGGLSLFGVGNATDLQQGNATNFANVEVSLINLYTRPVDINGSDNESFQVALEDDFTGLINHFMLIHGYLSEV